MAVQRVHLIRHGQTDWNMEGRWQGHAPVPLNTEGLAQARALADYLPQLYRLAAVYSSDLPRAWQTALVLAGAFNLTPQADERLREHLLGIFQGYTLAEIEARYPVELAAQRADPMHYVIPNGESRLMLQQRASAAFQEIVAQAAGDDVAIVSHGGTIKMMLLKLFPDEPDLAKVHLHNTSVTTIERNGAGWHLNQVASIVHLSPDVADLDVH